MFIYRAKRKDNNEWVEGYYSFDDLNARHLIFEKNLCHLIPSYCWSAYGGWQDILPETLSISTGRTDNTKWEELKEEEQQEWLNSGKPREQWKGKMIFSSFPFEDGTMSKGGDVVASHRHQEIKPLTTKIKNNSILRRMHKGKIKIIFHEGSFFAVKSQTKKYPLNSLCIYYLNLKIIGNQLYETFK